jgi:hypothetical protein
MSKCPGFVRYAGKSRLSAIASAMPIIKAKRSGIPIFRKFAVLMKKADQSEGKRSVHAAYVPAL